MSIEVSKVTTLSGHRDCIYTLESSFKPELVLSAGGDGMIAEWNLADPKQGRLIAQVKSSVYSLRRFGQSKLIVGENTEGIHVIDLEQKQEISSLKLGSVSYYDIQVWGKYALVASGDGSVVYVDLPANRIVRTIKESNARARSISINDRLNEFTVGYSDHHFRVFDLKTGEKKFTWKGHSNSIFCVKYNKEGDKLITAGRDATFRVWDVNSGYELEKEVVAHMYAINNLDYSPDGKHFVTCSMDKSIKVWDSQSYSLLKVIDKARHAGHGTSVNKVLWSDYKDLLVSGSDDRSLSVWDIAFNV